MNVSIITINYNNASGLKKTIESVVAQSYTNFEYIVIDGGSNDGSRDLIKQHAERIRYWVSENDGGIYNAQNKGINVAAGKYLLFLNSGDYLVDDSVLSKACDLINDEDIVYGDLSLIDNKNNSVLKTYPSLLTFDYFYLHNESLPHPSAFIKKSLFKKVGLYNEAFKIVSDWEFWLKAIFLYQATYKKIPVPISVFSLDGVSSTKKNIDLARKEKEEVYTKFFSGFVNDYNRHHSIISHLNSNFFARALRKMGLLKYGF